MAIREEERRAGRPRNTQIGAAALEATLALLAEVGYGRLAMEEVARRAGTTKPALYRRWPTRQHLVLAALGGRLGDIDVPDSGCTMCDLGEAIGVFVKAFQRLPPNVIGPLLAECAADAEVRAEFMATLFDPPRAAVRRTLERAVERGDLRRDLDLGLAVDLVGSLVHDRLLFGHAPLSEADIEAVVEALLGGIATDYPALLERSRSLSGDADLHSLHS